MKLNKLGLLLLIISLFIQTTHATETKETKESAESKRGQEQVAETLDEKSKFEALSNEILRLPDKDEIKIEDYKKIQGLIARDKTIINARDPLGKTNLINAIVTERFDVAKWLIDNGADVTIKDVQGVSALSYAMDAGDNELVIKIISKIPKDKLKKIVNEQGQQTVPVKGKAILMKTQTPLMKAAETGKLEIVRLLLEGGANPLIKDNKNQTAKDFAKQKDHEDVVEVIKKYEQEYIKNEEALIKAVRHGDLNRVKELLVSESIDINYSGGRALVATAQLYRCDVVKLLLEAGADINAKDDNGQTLLMQATRYADRNKAIINFLLEHGADVLARDDSGQTALDIIQRIMSIPYYHIPPSTNVYYSDKEKHDIKEIASILQKAKTDAKAKAEEEKKVKTQIEAALAYFLKHLHRG